MTIPTKADPSRFASHQISDANDHAQARGDGSRVALPAMPAPKRPMKRRAKVARRAPFLPDHPRAAHALAGHSRDHSKGHSKR